MGSPDLFDGLCELLNKKQKTQKKNKKTLLEHGRKNAEKCI